MCYDAFGKVTWLDAAFATKANSDYGWIALLQDKCLIMGRVLKLLFGRKNAYFYRTIYDRFNNFAHYQVSLNKMLPLIHDQK